MAYFKTYVGGSSWHFFKGGFCIGLHISIWDFLDFYHVVSIADPGCLSRILIFVHPGSRILDPKQQQKKEMSKVFLSYLFFVATNITKL